MRLSHISTHYPTGVPLIPHDVVAAAFVFVVAGAIVNHNQFAAGMAGVALGWGATLAYLVHRLDMHANH